MGRGKAASRPPRNDSIMNDLFLADDMGTLEFHVQGKHVPAVIGDGIQLFGQGFLQLRTAGDAQQGGPAPDRQKPAPVVRTNASILS